MSRYGHVAVGTPQGALVGLLLLSIDDSPSIWLRCIMWSQPLVLFDTTHFHLAYTCANKNLRLHLQSFATGALHLAD